MRVLTLGTFDILHYGHLNLLKRCHDLAGEHSLVSVGLNTDEFIEEYKGKAPIMTYEERKQNLLATRMVFQVVPNDQQDGTVKKAIEVTNSNLIVIGSDWGRKDYLDQIGLTWDWMDANNISLSYVPYTHTISSSEIKERCR